MSGRRESGTGMGCLGLILAAGAALWVLQHLVQILVVLGVTAAAGLLLWGAVAGWQLAAARVAERRRCPVCQGWSASVLLTDLDADGVAALCADHGARYTRIRMLEEQVRPWEF